MVLLHLNKAKPTIDSLPHSITLSSLDTATSSQIHYSIPLLPSPAFTVCQDAYWAPSSDKSFSVDLPAKLPPAIIKAPWVRFIMITGRLYCSMVVSREIWVVGICVVTPRCWRIVARCLGKVSCEHDCEHESGYILCICVVWVGCHRPPPPPVPPLAKAHVRPGGVSDPLFTIDNGNMRLRH